MHRRSWGWLCLRGKEAAEKGQEQPGKGGDDETLADVNLFMRGFINFDRSPKAASIKIEGCRKGNRSLHL